MPNITENLKSNDGWVAETYPIGKEIFIHFKYGMKTLARVIEHKEEIYAIVVELVDKPTQKLEFPKQFLTKDGNNIRPVDNFHTEDLEDLQNLLDAIKLDLHRASSENNAAAGLAAIAKLNQVIKLAQKIQKDWNDIETAQHEHF
jgi:hypothetical protein